MLLQEIKNEFTQQFPGIPDAILNAAFTLAARKMIAYEKAGMPQEDDYIFLLIPDCIRAVLSEI